MLRHRTQHGATPLSVASECGRALVVDPLAAGGADVDATNKVSARSFPEFQPAGAVSARTENFFWKGGVDEGGAAGRVVGTCCEKRLWITLAFQIFCW